MEGINSFNSSLSVHGSVDKTLVPKETPIEMFGGRGSVDFPAELVQVLPSRPSDVRSINPLNPDPADAASPPSLDLKQNGPETTTPPSQSQRAENTTPQSGPTAPNESGALTQDQRIFASVPQLATNMPTPSLTPFDSSLEGAPKREFLSGPPTDIFYPSPERYIISFPAYGQELKGILGISNLSGEHFMNTNKNATLSYYIQTSNNAMDPLRIKLEMTEIVERIVSFHNSNPNEPIPITKSDIMKIFTYEAYELQGNKDKQLPNALADSIFVNGLFDRGEKGGNIPYKYNVLDEIGGNKPGIYDGGTINYMYQGIISAFHGEDKKILKAKIILYNNTMKVGQIVLNKTNEELFPYVGKYEDNGVILNLGSFGYDFYKGLF